MTTLIRVLDVDQHTLPRDLMHDASREWPAGDWPHWLSYASPLESKRTCNDWSRLPESCRLLLGRLALLDVGRLLGVDAAPDLTLHGGGMHGMARGDHLSCHLDADRHPVTGLERAANAILFLTPLWMDRWGGRLDFWDHDRTERICRVTPAMGRLVVFETGDTSYHSVETLTCPEGFQRKTLALYWWGEPRTPSMRPRAQFVTVAGQSDGLDDMRMRRAGLSPVANPG